MATFKRASRFWGSAVDTKEGHLQKEATSARWFAIASVIDDGNPLRGKKREDVPDFAGCEHAGRQKSVEFGMGDDAALARPLQRGLSVWTEQWMKWSHGTGLAFDRPVGMADYAF
jgi:hypothetical protein